MILRLIILILLLSINIFAGDVTYYGTGIDIYKVVNANEQQQYELFTGVLKGNLNQIVQDIYEQTKNNNDYQRISIKKQINGKLMNINFINPNSVINEMNNFVDTSYYNCLTSENCRNLDFQSYPNSSCNMKFGIYFNGEHLLYGKLSRLSIGAGAIECGSVSCPAVDTEVDYYTSITMLECVQYDHYACCTNSDMYEPSNQMNLCDGCLMVGDTLRSICLVTGNAISVINSLPLCSSITNSDRVTKFLNNDNQTNQVTQDLNNVQVVMNEVTNNDDDAGLPDDIKSLTPIRFNDTTTNKFDIINYSDNSSESDSGSNDTGSGSGDNVTVNVNFDDTNIVNAINDLKETNKNLVGNEDTINNVQAPDYDTNINVPDCSSIENKVENYINNNPFSNFFNDNVKLNLNDSQCSFPVEININGATKHSEINFCQFQNLFNMIGNILVGISYIYILFIVFV